MTIYLDLPQAVAIAASMDLRLRDIGLLSSAIARPESAMFGVEAYADVFLKAGALFSSLAQNHAFFDGNKRFAWVTTLTFLELNGIRTDMPLEEAFDLVLAVAQGHAGLAQIAGALRRRSVAQ
ncbi:type II toxin-antitoxin system death-on-curing family toxin [Microbacterium sp. LjRoot45]|uniref:type II toxin-antitoxin system death-on-curing family toxin n=1 Tax=Microbacterium sp. LjRoot45 TaxID=3342329 RepID=UPI003ECC982F